MVQDVKENSLIQGMRGRFRELMGMSDAELLISTSNERVDFYSDPLYKITTSPYIKRAIRNRDLGFEDYSQFLAESIDNSRLSHTDSLSEDFSYISRNFRHCIYGPKASNISVEMRIVASHAKEIRRYFSEHGSLEELPIKGLLRSSMRVLEMIMRVGPQETWNQLQIDEGIKHRNLDEAYDECFCFLIPNPRIAVPRLIAHYKSGGKWISVPEEFASEAEPFD